MVGWKIACWWALIGQSCISFIGRWFLLVSLAECCYGFLACYDDEEFAVLLPGISWQEVAAFAQQLCEVIRQFRLEHANHGDDKTWISISVGAAIMDAEHIYRNVDRLLKTADQQLYHAKILHDSACIK